MEKDYNLINWKKYENDNGNIVKKVIGSLIMDLIEIMIEYICIII